MRQWPVFSYRTGVPPFGLFDQVFYGFFLPYPAADEFSLLEDRLGGPVMLVGRVSVFPQDAIDHAAELVCGLPEGGLEAEVGASVGGVAVRRAFCTCQANPSQDVLGDYGVFSAVL